MSNKEEKTSLRSRVIDAIENRRVMMRPRWHFVLLFLLRATGLVVAFLGLLYLISFILFVLRHSGLLFTPLFGFGGLYRLLFSLPWILVFFSLFFLVVLEVLVRRYAFAYRRPLVYSILGIFVLVFLGGIIVVQTSFHSRLLRYAREERLPVAGFFYRAFTGVQPEHVFRGYVLEKTKDGLIIEGSRGVRDAIRITPQTRLPFGGDFDGGDVVIVFGNRIATTTISAIGIKKVADDRDPDDGSWSPPRRRDRGPFMK